MIDASLEDLNGRLQNKVTFRSFRPNIVVSGCQAFAEVYFRTYVDIIYKFFKNLLFLSKVVYDFFNKFKLNCFSRKVVFDFPRVYIIRFFSTMNELKKN